MLQSSWDALPDDLVAEIIGDTAALEVAQLGQTCHRLHRLCRVPCAIQNFVHGQVDDVEIAQRLRELAEDLHRWPGLRRYTQLITPQVATSLYDHVLQAPFLSVDVKLELQTLLCVVNRAVFQSVLASPPLRPDLAELVANAPDLDVPKDLDGLPPWLLPYIDAYLQDSQKPSAEFDPDLIEAVRRRYPAPFDRVFPRNPELATYLCQNFPSAITTPAMLLALQRYGIRFGMREFLKSVAIHPHHVPDILPLLYSDDIASVPEKYLGHQTSRHLDALLATPVFRFRIRSNPRDFLQLIFYLIEHHKYGHIQRLLDKPFFYDLVNAIDNHHRTPLFYALFKQAYDAVKLLLEVPNINLYQETRAGTTLFHLLFLVRENDLLSVCGFSTVILSAIDDFMMYLLHLIENREVDLFLFLIAHPFFHAVPQHCKLWLLQYAAKTPALYEGVLGTLMPRESPDDVQTESALTDPPW